MRMIAPLLFRDVQWIKTNGIAEFYWYDRDLFERNGNAWHGTAFRYRYVAERHSFCVDSQQEPRNSLERTSVVHDLSCIQ